MTRYTYLLIDLLSISAPLLFSFHSRIKFYRYWTALLPAIAITAFIYLIWDSWFTHRAIWGFNPKYIVGLYIGNLPIEEILFFICIPYACLFTFECLSGIIQLTFLQNSARLINIAFAAFLLIVAVIFHAKLYTASAFLLLSIIVLIGALQKVAWLPKFYAIYGILLFPFLVVNGLLTGTGLSAPVVWYNSSGIIGLRILTIPVEDVFYGMSLILINVWIYTLIRARGNAQVKEAELQIIKKWKTKR